MFPFVSPVANSGTISTTNIVDRILGLFSAMLRFKPLDGINDHSKFEYKRLFAQAVLNKRVSMIAKTKSVVVDVMQKVTLVLFVCFCIVSLNVRLFVVVVDFVVVVVVAAVGSVSAVLVVIVITAVV